MRVKSKLYVAYGSNMNVPQMAYRCPGATIAGESTLQDYRLMFRGAHGSAVATVEPCAGQSVPVLIWRITPPDEADLDRYEGLPHLYRKEKVKIKLDGKTVMAMIYIMNDGRPLGQPSAYYYGVILDGYKAAGFDPDVLVKATEYSANIQ